ncbi:MAG: DUF2304 domain-containing protein [Bacteroidetes bacterium]|jgi:hypothetical protein|nr:DUF2304 domain-containing protein [Bacteroidota bacterium]MBT6686623.1 DUF2304 domain-containing protein [Bacteroidota bacterium]MBT7143311.1 DUF2304 domain-containing protein [Bacteroidota bacterium]MBT7493409.1 DUF2304 domain-containing protein [Bacteroidota bacterium]
MLSYYVFQKIQAVAIASSILMFVALLLLIRKKRIKEEFSLLWLFFGVVFIVFSVWRSGLDFVAGIVGISYPPAAMFMLFMLAFFLILIEFSVIISRLSDRNKNLTQEVGLLKMELKSIKSKIENLNIDKKKTSNH